MEMENISRCCDRIELLLNDFPELIVDAIHGNTIGLEDFFMDVINDIECSLDEIRNCVGAMKLRGLM